MRAGLPLEPCPDYVFHDPESTSTLFPGLGFPRAKREEWRLKPRISGTSILAAGLIVLALASPAYGDTSSVSVAPGGLTIRGGGFGGTVTIALDGQAASADLDLADLTVTDARGSGAGWTVSVEATPFLAWDPESQTYLIDGHGLPSGSLSMAQPDVSAQGTESLNPALREGPYVLDGGAAVEVGMAAPGTGMGTYLFTHQVPLTLTVPANAYAGTYRSEVTFSIISGV